MARGSTQNNSHFNTPELNFLLAVFACSRNKHKIATRAESDGESDE
jgi:hypothetical protein